MRIKQILLEYNQQKTIDNMMKDETFKNRLMTDMIAHPNMWSRKFGMTWGEIEVTPDLMAKVVTFIESKDPTTKKAYVLPMINWFKNGSMRYLEDAGKATAAILTIRKFKNRLTGFDPMKVTFLQFLEKADELNQTQSKTELGKAETQKFFENGDAKLFYDGPDCKIIVPHTWEAAKYFGRGTKWCTSSEDTMEHFADYTTNGPLYIILFKGKNQRWQFHFQDWQFMDERDEDLDTDSDEFQQIMGHFHGVIEGLLNDTIRDHEQHIKMNALKWIPRLSDKFLVSLDHAYFRDGAVNSVLEYVENPSEKLIKACFVKNAYAFSHIDYPTEEEQISAFERAPKSIQYFDYPCEKLQELIIETLKTGKLVNRNYLRDIKNLTPKVGEMIMDWDHSQLYHVKSIPNATQLALVKLHPEVIQYFYYKNKEASRLAFKLDPRVIEHISPYESLDYEMCLAGVKKRPEIIMYVPDVMQTEEMQRIAIEANPYLINKIDHVKDGMVELSRKIIQRSGREQRHYVRDLMNKGQFGA